MPDLWMDVDTALSEVPVNILPLIDDSDFKSVEDAIAYDAAGMDLTWNFVTTAGAFSSTSVTPTTGGAHDWAEHTADDGMYTLEIPASGGTINNDTEGFGWFTGVCTGVLPWRGPVIGFRAAEINDTLIDSGSALSDLESGINVIQTKTSDTHSRLVVVESAIDSDQTSRTAAISDIKSELVVLSDAVSTIDAAIDSDQTSRATAISDVKSELVILSDAVSALDAAVDSDQTSRASAISDVKSRLVVVESAIDSDQTSRTAAISDVKSELVVLSDAVSALDAAVDSDQTSRTSAISDVKSRLVVVEAAIDSDQLLVLSDTSDILSKLTVWEGAAGVMSDMASGVNAIQTTASDTHSRLVVVETAIDSDQVSRTSAISDVKSRLVIVESAIDSDQVSRTAAVSDVKSLVTLVRSDTTKIESDAALLDAAHTEPSGVPTANETPLDKLGYLFLAMRNAKTVTATAKTIKDDAGNSEWKHALSDDGTTYSEGEAAAP